MPGSLTDKEHNKNSSLHEYIMSSNKEKIITPATTGASTKSNPQTWSESLGPRQQSSPNIEEKNIKTYQQSLSRDLRSERLPKNTIGGTLLTCNSPNQHKFVATRSLFTASVYNNQAT